MLEAIAERAAATDVFVLKRLAEDRYFNADGWGRGAGWAGVVSLDVGAEPLIESALRSGVARRSSGVPFRAFGPYWSSDVVAVANDDAVVVLGGGTTSTLDDETVREAAADASRSAGEVSAEQRDAQEEELRQAVSSIEAIEEDSLEGAAEEIARRCAQALSCEFGAVLLYGPPPRVFMADEGWRPAATPEEVIAALLPLRDASQDIFVEQDLSVSAYPYSPLSFEDGLVARCSVEFDRPGHGGLLVVAHAATQPRGFTSLCQTVAKAMGMSSGPVLAQLNG